MRKSLFHLGEHLVTQSKAGFRNSVSPARPVLITARLPKDHAGVISLSCELPEVDADVRHREEWREFIQLAVECGAVGFYREA